MTPTFLKAFEYTLGNEGGYTNDPDDSGGPTKWGIIQEEYSRYLGYPASIDDVRRMPKEHAEEIYYKNYWKPLALDHVISTPVAIAIFDQAVNRGVRTVAKAVQGIVGVEQDGHIGPKTLAAINGWSHLDANKDASDFLVMEIEKQAESAYRAIAERNPKNQKFLKGWLNRARRLLTLIGVKK